MPAIETQSFQRSVPHDILCGRIIDPSARHGPHIFVQQSRHFPEIAYILVDHVLQLYRPVFRRGAIGKAEVIHFKTDKRAVQKIPVDQWWYRIFQTAIREELATLLGSVSDEVNTVVLESTL